MAGKSFDEIMKEITSGMTGDQRHDREYLNEKMEEYQEHPLSEQILKELGRLLFTVMPEEEQAQFKATMKQEGVALHLAIQAAMHHMRNKKYLQAREVLVKEIKRHEKIYPYKNTDTVEYYCFDEPFERTLHSFYSKSQKKCENVDVPFPMAYYVYAMIMMELGQMETARKALDKGLRWNPYSAVMHLKRTEIISQSLDEIALLEGSKNALRFAFKPDTVASCYANFARYYIGQKEYELAIGCCMISQNFSENNEDAMILLKEIYNVTEGKVMPPSMEKVRRLAEKEELPFGPDRDVVGLAFTYGKKYYEEGNYEPAKYFLQIGYDLTGDEDAGKVLEDIEKRVKNE